MLDLRSGLPYHWIRNGLLHDHPKLDRDVSCEVLVVGGGITGALCAHALAKAGMGTVVIDARAIGTGSTAASTALLQYELDTPLYELAGRIGEADAARTYELGLVAVRELLDLAGQLHERSAIPRPSLQFASRRSHEDGLRQEQVIRRRHGIAVDLLERQDVRRLFPSIDAVGLMSHEAAEVDPYALAHRLLQEVVRLGGSVFDRTEMVHFERGADGRKEVRTRSSHRIKADHLVMATGYESQRYLRKPVMQLHSTYAVASERIAQDVLWHQDSLIWETAQPYHYLRTTPDRRVIIGGSDEPFRDPARRDALLERKTRKLERAFKDLMPFVPFVPEYAWCGTFGSTRDGLPYIDIDPEQRAWFVLGMGGNGITFSQVGAGIVRDAIMGRPNADARLFRFDR